MLVQGRRQLFPRPRQLFPGVVCLEHQGVPLVLKGLEQRRQRCEVWGARSDDAGGLDVEQVIGVELVVGPGFFSLLLDVLEDQSLLENSAYQRQVSAGGPWVSRIAERMRLTCFSRHHGLLGDLSRHYQPCQSDFRCSMGSKRLAHVRKACWRCREMAGGRVRLVPSSRV